MQVSSHFYHKENGFISSMNGTKESINKLVSDLNSANLEPYVDVVVAPPFVYINQVKNSLTDRIEIAAQNSWIGKGGAFTGEIRLVSSV